MESLFPCPKATAVREHMAHTTGTFEWHRHWLGLIYTDGIEFVAETCGAHWLIDLVASHQPEIRKRWPNDHDFQVWNLVKIENDRRFEWLAEAWTDTPFSEGSFKLASQRIQRSDFPDELSPFQFWVEGGTMLLKEEH